MSDEAERRPGSGEIWLAVTKHHRVQVDSILIDQTKSSEAVGQLRPGDLDLPVALRLQLTDRGREVIFNQARVAPPRSLRAASRALSAPKDQPEP